KLVVVFATDLYFERWYCWKEWSIARAAWDTVEQRRAESPVGDEALDALLVLLPAGAASTTLLERLPPPLRRRNLIAAAALDLVATEIERRRMRIRRTLGERLAALGVDEPVRNLIGGADPIPQPRPPKGVAVPAGLRMSIGDRFVGRAVELYQL